MNSIYALHLNNYPPVPTTGFKDKETKELKSLLESKFAGMALRSREQKSNDYLTCLAKLYGPHCKLVMFAVNSPTGVTVCISSAFIIWALVKPPEAFWGSSSLCDEISVKTCL